MPPRATKSKSPLARWTSKLATFPTLSVRQPWAWLIVNGYKDVENRPRRMKYRGPLLIHAGLSRAACSEENLAWIKKRFGVSIPPDFQTGGIVGIVEVVDCVEKHRSKWFEKGGFGYVLTKPRRLPFRACKGQLSLFKPKFSEPTIRS